MVKEESRKINALAEESELKNNICKIIKGCLFSIVFSLILLVIYAICLTYTELSETTITPVVITIVGISILLGSTISSRKIKKNGLINGGITGFCYVIILYLASSLSLVGFHFSMGTLILLLVGTITGMLGGIIGVNTGKGWKIRNYRK